MPRRVRIRTVAGVLGILALCPASRFAQEEPPTPAALEADRLVAELLARREGAEQDRVRELASHATPEALGGLLRVYENIRATGIRKAVLRNLYRFAGVAGADPEARAHLVDVALDETAGELRQTAIDALALFAAGGRSSLVEIVEADVELGIRLLALERHVLGSAARGTPSEVSWYRTMVEDRPSPGQAMGEGTLDRRYPDPLRRVAFDGLRPHLAVSELATAAEDPYFEIQLDALAELQDRGGPTAASAAHRVYANQGMRVVVLLQAARMLLAHDGPTWSLRMVDDATARSADRGRWLGTAAALRVYLAETADKALRERLIHTLKRGDDADKMFAIEALGEAPGDDLDALLALRLGESEPELRARSAEWLARRGATSQLTRVEERLRKEKAPEVLAELVHAWGALAIDQEAGQDRLRLYASHEDRRVRHAALRVLAERRDARDLPIFHARLDHPDWSTRLVALRAIEDIGDSLSISHLIRNLGDERERIATELVAALERMTGERLGRNPLAWRAWWERTKSHGDGAPTSPSTQPSSRATSLRTSTEFFGLPLGSDHVCFVIDVSGSMGNRLGARSRGSDAPTRLRRVKDELVRSLSSMPESSFVNLVAFNSQVDAVAKELQKLEGSGRREMLYGPTRLTAGGSTNLYGGLLRALEDSGVDTIVLLSDGWPTSGELVEPMAIRESISRWNRYVGVRIHTITVGDELDLMRGLAEDSGGEHRRVW